jgi:hypothetical protein
MALRRHRQAPVLRMLRERTFFQSLALPRPGYEPMVESLRSGEGHSPSESGKERQRPVDWTGYPYADEALIPPLRGSGLFLDQE